jgi:hypothetical protein
MVHSFFDKRLKLRVALHPIAAQANLSLAFGLGQAGAFIYQKKTIADGFHLFSTIGTNSVASGFVEVCPVGEIWAIGDVVTRHTNLLLLAPAAFGKGSGVAQTLELTNLAKIILLLKINVKLTRC